MPQGAYGAGQEIPVEICRNLTLIGVVAPRSKALKIRVSTANILGRYKRFEREVRLSSIIWLFGATIMSLTSLCLVRSN
jgi:hypothetical protein